MLFARLIHVTTIIALLAMLSGPGATVFAGGCVKLQKVEVCLDPALSGTADTRPTKEVAPKSCLDALLDCISPPAFSGPGRPVTWEVALSAPLALPSSPWKPPRLAA